jgi:hypothetical protein
MSDEAKKIIKIVVVIVIIIVAFNFISNKIEDAKIQKRVDAIVAEENEKAANSTSNTETRTGIKDIESQTGIPVEEEVTGIPINSIEEEGIKIDASLVTAEK